MSTKEKYHSKIEFFSFSLSFTLRKISILTQSIPSLKSFLFDFWVKILPHEIHAICSILYKTNLSYKYSFKSFLQSSLTSRSFPTIYKILFFYAYMIILLIYHYVFSIFFLHIHIPVLPIYHPNPSRFWLVQNF